jgi:hypothetical protein
MAQIWSEVLDHPVRALRLPPAAMANPGGAAAALAAGIAGSLVRAKLISAPHIVRGITQAANARGIRSWPTDAIKAYITMMDYYDTHGLPAGDMTGLPKLLGRAPNTYRDFANREAAARLRH